MAITGSDLRSNPQNIDDDYGVGNMPDATVTPFDKGFDALTEIEGKRLDIMTRMNPKVAKANGIMIAQKIRHPTMNYLQAFMDGVERCNVSLGGKGRDEIARVVQAGAGVPPSYYDGGKTTENKTTFTVADDKEII